MITHLVVRRVLLGIVTIWVISMIVFFGIEILPGDVANAVLGQFATPETLQVIRDSLGLERPAHLRYFEWLGRLLTGDLGATLGTGRPISSFVAPALSMTVLLGCVTAAIAIPVSISLGLIAAAAVGSTRDRIIGFATLFLVSGPEFLLATLLVMLFAVELQWAPAMSQLAIDATTGDLIAALFLPALTLSLVMLAPMTRMTRAAILNVMASPAIEMALLKGVPRSRIIVWHVLPNAIAPIANIVVMNLAYLFTGVFIIEVIFVYPGLGKLMVDAVEGRDIPLAQTCAMLFCTIYVGLNIVADVIAIISNPRLRYPA